MRFRGLFNVLLLIIGVLLFGSCETGERLKVGLLLPNTETEYFTKAKTTIERQIVEAGGEVATMDAQENENLQISQANELIESGVTVLIVSAINSNTAGAIVRNARENGVMVVAYDRVIANSDLDYYVTYNSVEVGRLMASYAISKKPTGKYVLLYGDSSDRNAQFVKQGFHEVLDPYFNSKKIDLLYRTFTTDWNGENAAHTLQKILDFTEEKPDVVLSSYDGMSTISIELLEEYGLASKVLVTGQNGEIEAFRNIIKGKQAMTVYKPVEGLAVLAANIAIDLMLGNDIESTTTINNGRKNVPSILLDPILIDRDNVDAEIIAKGVYSREELY